MNKLLAAALISAGAWFAWESTKEKEPEKENEEKQEKDLTEGDVKE